jgi:hypothetical protein
MTPRLAEQRPGTDPVELAQVSAELVALSAELVVLSAELAGTIGPMLAKVDQSMPTSVGCKEGRSAGEVPWTRLVAAGLAQEEHRPGPQEAR